VPPVGDRRALDADDAAAEPDLDVLMDVGPVDAELGLAPVLLDTPGHVVSHGEAVGSVRLRDVGVLTSGASDSFSHEASLRNGAPTGRSKSSRARWR